MTLRHDPFDHALSGLDTDTNLHRSSPLIAEHEDRDPESVTANQVAAFRKDLTALKSMVLPGGDADYKRALCIYAKLKSAMKSLALPLRDANAPFGNL